MRNVLKHIKTSKIQETSKSHEKPGIVRTSESSGKHESHQNAISNRNTIVQRKCRWRRGDWGNHSLLLNRRIITELV